MEEKREDGLEWYPIYVSEAAGDVALGIWRDIAARCAYDDREGPGAA